MKNIFPILLFGTALFVASCSVDKEPYDGFSESQILGNKANLEAATLGNYALIKSDAYVRNYHIMVEYASDNVALSGTTTDPLFFSYNYGHLTNQANTNSFWRQAYAVINGANKIIEAIPNPEDAEQKQLIGENYFLRAMAYFDLVNIFGRPYSQSPETNLGVPLVLKSDITALPDRNTVKEVYTQILSDLQTAETLMTINKKLGYATKEAAQALLARVYLFMGDYIKALSYADAVIKSGRFSLYPGSGLANLFIDHSDNNKEIIFAIKHNIKDDRGWGAIGSMYYTSPGGVGYGEMYASRSLRDLYAKYPNDLRAGFIVPKYKPNTTEIETRNGYPKYFITKYSNQEGIATLSSPVYLRLADMYLIRAEANAKLGNNEAAIEDVNRIRTRAGLSGNELYTTTDLKGKASVLEVVLEERRLELAFESSRKLDLFRNNLDLVRDYPGTHAAGGPTGSGNQLIKATDARVVHFIPENETVLNKNLQQNP